MNIVNSNNLSSTYFLKYFKTLAESFIDHRTLILQAGLLKEQKHV